MNISIFDIMGPIMIGPSSSHTAGAARLARIASIIAFKSFHRISFYPHGSFAKTGIGHKTDRALLAGALGIHEDDERIKSIYEIAEKLRITYKFYEADLGDVHENTCRIVFYHDDGTESVIVGSSVGGGRILITEINSVPTEITAEAPTLVITHYDKKGVVSEVSGLLAEHNVNIGVMRLTREERGKIATSVIETDSVISPELEMKLTGLDNIISIHTINP